MKYGMMAAVAAATVMSGAAHAKFKSGAYSANGYQTICLYTDGTWNSTTYANWGGEWSNAGSIGHVFGNYNSGAGNDSMVEKGKGGSWTEWSDSLSYVNVIDPASFTYVGSLSANGCSEGDNSRAPQSSKPPAAR